MKRLLFCLVALLAALALVVPTYAAEMKINGLNRIKFISNDNLDGDDTTDDNNNFVKQRLRMYFTSIASENLKVVYKNEIDFEWGDAVGSGGGRGDGGQLGGDVNNLETKNVYMEFMVPDTPLKTTMGLQGVTLHRGHFISDDVSALRFDMNFDPVSVLAYWAMANNGDGNVFTNSSDDVWQLVASAGYKAENMDARLSIGYEKGQDDPVVAGVKDDDFFLVMGEFGMSFDMASFFIIAARNFGEVDGGAGDRNYDGYMLHAGVDIALDMATISVQGMLFSGDKEGDLDDDYRSMSGTTFSWAEIPSDGNFWEANSKMPQINWRDCADFNGCQNTPSNMWALNVGADIKPTDTTKIAVDLWYIAMVEDRTVGGNDEDTIGTEVDVTLTQKIYDNLDALIVASYMLADDGFGTDTGPGSSESGEDAYILGLAFHYTF